MKERRRRGRRRRRRRGGGRALATLVLLGVLVAAGTSAGAPLPSAADERAQLQVFLETGSGAGSGRGAVAFSLEAALREYEGERASGDTSRTGAWPMTGGYRTKVKRCMWCRGFVDSSADLDKRDRKSLALATEYKKKVTEQQVKYDERWESHLAMSLDRAERLFWAKPQEPEPAAENEVSDFHRRMRHMSSTKGMIVMFNFRVCVNEQSQTFGEALAAATYGDDGYTYECTNSKR